MSLSGESTDPIDTMRTLHGVDTVKNFKAHASPPQYMLASNIADNVQRIQDVSDDLCKILPAFKQALDDLKIQATQDESTLFPHEDRATHLTKRPWHVHERRRAKHDAAHQTPWRHGMHSLASHAIARNVGDLTSILDKYTSLASLLCIRIRKTKQNMTRPQFSMIVAQPKNKTTALRIPKASFKTPPLLEDECRDNSLLIRIHKTHSNLQDPFRGTPVNPPPRTPKGPLRRDPQPLKPPFGGDPLGATDRQWPSTNGITMPRGLTLEYTAKDSLTQFIMQEQKHPFPPPTLNPLKGPLGARCVHTHLCFCEVYSDWLRRTSAPDMLGQDTFCQCWSEPIHPLHAHAATLDVHTVTSHDHTHQSLQQRHDPPLVEELFRAPVSALEQDTRCDHEISHPVGKSVFRFLGVLFRRCLFR